MLEKKSKIYVIVNSKETEGEGVEGRESGVRASTSSATGERESVVQRLAVIDGTTPA